MTKPLLPPLRTHIPDPVGNCFESCNPVGGEPLIGVGGSLYVHPLAESEAVFLVALRHVGVTFKLDEALKPPKPELPARCALIDEVHVECINEVGADAGGDVEVDFPRQT